MSNHYHALVWLVHRVAKVFHFNDDDILSMIAALQAPIIMKSQNRQSKKDRQMAAHDYEVNLKAEMEVMALHEKMDALRTDHLAVLMAKQQRQIDLLTELLERTERDGGMRLPA